MLAVALVCALMAFGTTKEVAVTPVTGKVTMFENKKALPNAFVTFSPEYRDEEDYKFKDYTVRTKADGTFSFRRLPVGMYSVYVRGTAHDVQKRMVAVTEGGTNELDFEAIARPPSIEFSLDNPVFLPDQEIAIQSSGLLVDRKLSLEVRRVEPKRIQDAHSLADVLTAVTRNRNPKNAQETGVGPVVATDTFEPDMIDLEGSFTTKVKVPRLEKGVYMGKVSSKGFDRYFWFTVTDLGLVTKSGDGHGTAWAVDLRTGRPRQGVSLTLVSDNGIKAVGTTDADGLATFDIPAARDDKQHQQLMMAEAGDSHAYTWWYPQSEAHKDVAWTVTDRPVYRPGDTVHFKSFIRHPQDAGYGPSTLSQVEVQLRGPDGETVGTLSKTVGVDGTVDGEFQIENESPTGDYEITLTSGDWSDSHFFPVAEYRKPEYNIQVAANKGTHYRGDRVPVTVTVTTYTGEPAVGATINAQVYRQPQYWEDEAYGSSIPDEYSEYVKSQKLTTDDNGRAVMDVDTTYKAPNQNHQDWPTSPPDSEIFKVSVDVTGTGDRYYSGSGSFNVYQGDLKLVASTDDYAGSVGKPFHIRMDARGRESQSPATGRVTATITRANYERTAQEAEDGQDYRTVKTNYAVQTAVLDSTGRATLDFTPDKPGDYSVLLACDDSHGRRVEDTLYFWVPGGAERPDQGFVSLELDKKAYKTADSPKAYVRTDEPGATVLVTLETDSVKWTKVVPMDAELAEVDLPSLAATPQGASVSVCRVKALRFQMAQQDVRIGDRGKSVNVSVTSDRNKVKPGEDVTYQVKTTDDHGGPVSASLAFSVVDEAVYAIKEDHNDPRETFWPARWSSVQTTWSFPAIYFDGGDKSPPDMKVRRVFKDTAFWSAQMRTGADGTASVTVRLPDNVTDWRATACAVTSEAAVGKGKASVVATQDLMVRLSLPPFMTQADTQQVSATVTNTTDNQMDVDLWLTLGDAKTKGETRLTQQVKPNSSKVVSWPLEAGGPGTAKVKVTAQSRQGPADAVEMTFPVRTNGRPEYWHAGGIVGGEGQASEASFDLDVLPQTATGVLEARIAPGLAGTMLANVDRLVDYPYGCVEQTLSRMVSAAVTRNALQAAGYQDADLSEKVDKILRQGFARLRDMRGYGGGWGWFRNDLPSPWVTAVALDGFRTLSDAGVAVPQDWPKEDVAWGLKTLTTPPRDEWEAKARLQLVAALAAHTPQKELLTAIDASLAVGVDKVQGGLDKDSVAWVALAYHRLTSSSDPSVAARAKAELPKWLKRLEGAAPRSAAEGSAWDNTETVALALVEIEPDSQTTKDVLYRLAAPPVKQSLVNTWSINQSVTAIARYLQAHPEKVGVGQSEFLVNGNLVGKAPLDRSTVLRVPIAGLKSGRNKLQVRAAGGGTAAFALDFKSTVYDPDAKPLALSSGFSIERSYHRMEVGMVDGQRRLVPARDASTEFRSGEVFRVRLVVRNKVALRYVAIDDYVPSNARTVELDRTLDGSSDWGYWWVGADYRDDRTTYFASDLPPGEHVLEYAVRAESPGLCFAPPADAFPMYDPGMVVRTGTGKLKVSPQ